MTAADFATMRGYWKAKPVADGDPTASPPSIGQGVAYIDALGNGEFGSPMSKSDAGGTPRSL